MESTVDREIFSHELRLKIRVGPVRSRKFSQPVEAQIIIWAERPCEAYVLGLNSTAHLSNSLAIGALFPLVALESKGNWPSRERHVRIYPNYGVYIRSRTMNGYTYTKRKGHV